MRILIAEDDYIIKPFKPDEFLSRYRKLCQLLPQPPQLEQNLS